MQRGAEFSTCGQYRYALWRVWNSAAPLVMFIGLNPCTAKAKTNDPTIKKCIELAKSWEVDGENYGGVVMMNLFSYCTPDPYVMKKQLDPIGIGNDYWLQLLVQETELIVAAWGDHGTHLNRAHDILRMLPDMMCFNQTKKGQPVHPLYQKPQAKLKPLDYLKAGYDPIKIFYEEHRQQNANK